MKGLKIGIVEDDKMLLTVFSFFVKELGHEVIGAYTNAEDVLKLCSETRPDIVLMDINLPDGIDGITAAEKLFYEFDVPSIYMSSYTDETTVNKAIKASTYGYLVKPIDKIALGITIDLVYFKHKNNHQLRMGEILIDNINDALLTISLNGKVTFCNNGATKIFEKNRNDIVDKSFSNLLNTLSSNFIQENFIEKTLSDKWYETEIIIKNNDNKNRFLYLTFSLLNDEIDEVFGIICYCKDITKKRIAEEGLKVNISNLKAIFNGATDALYIINSEFNLVEQNRLACYYQNNVLKSNYGANESIFNILHFISKEDLKSLIETSFDGVSHFIERKAIINNIEKHFRITIYPIFFEEKSEINRICVSLHDISELKRIEKDLEETRNELKPLFDSSIQRFYLSDLNLRVVAFNKSARDVIIKEFGKQLKRGDNVLDLLSGEERIKKFLEHFENAKRGHSIVYKENFYIKEKEVWNETHLDPVMNERGEINRILIWTLDVSEREKNLNELKETQERYALVAKGGNDGIWDWDMQKNTVYLSTRWKALLGYEDYELKNEFGVRDNLIYHEDFERSKKNLEDYINGKIPIYENEIRLKHKNGTYIWVIERGVLLYDNNGKPIRLAGSITDISRQKKIEIEILNSNKMLLEERQMFIQGSVVIARIKANDSKNIVFISDNVKEVLGYDVKKFYDGTITYDAIIHPDDKQFHVDERNEALKRNETNIEYKPYRMIKSDGSFLWVKDFSSILKDSDGNITEIVGYFIDITDQKNYEHKLEENQKKYYSLFNNAGDATVLIDLNDNIFDCNEKFESLFNVNRADVIGKSILNLIPKTQPDGSNSIEKRKVKIENALKGKVTTFYWQYIKKDNTLFDAEVSLTSVIINNTKYLQSSIRDITERKNIERNLKETEEKNRALLEAVPDLIFIIDKDGVYKYFKPDIYHELDVPVEFVIGKKLDYFFKGEMLNKVKGCIDSTISNGNIQSIEYELDSPKGMRSFEARISRIDKENILMIVRDKEQSKFYNKN